MKFKPTRSSLAIIVLLMLSSLPAMAAAPDVMSPSYLLNSDNLDPLLKSILISIFGAQFVGGEGSTALSQIIGYANYVAMGVAILITSYAMIGGALNTAASGEMLGRQWSTVWLPLRTSIGLGLITPAFGSVDYSVIQTLMAKTLIAGSIFANSAWGIVSENIVKYDTAFTSGLPLPAVSQGSDLLGSAFCAVNEYYRRNGEGRSDPFPLYTIIQGNDTGETISTQVTGGPGGKPYALSGGGTYIKSIRYGSTGACGSQGVFDGSIADLQPGTKAAIKAASLVVLDTLNASHQLENEARARKVTSRTIELYLGSNANSSGEYAGKFRNEARELSDAGAQIIADYPKKMNDAIMNAFRSNIDVAKASGELVPYKSWIMAPANYIRLTQHSLAPNSVIQSLSEGLTNPSWRVCKPGADDCPYRSVDKTVTALSTDYTHVSTMLLVGEIESATNTSTFSGAVSSNGSSSNSSRGDDSTGCAGAECKQSQFVTSYTSSARAIIFSADFLAKVGQGVADADSAKQEGIGQVSIGAFNGGASPAFVLSGIGHSLNTLLAVTWGTGLAGAALAHGVGDSGLGFIGGGAISGAFDYVVKTMWPVLLSMLMAGGALAYLPPLAIIFRWVVAVANYLLICVEAMTAAPLAVVKMLTPEGDGIAGNGVSQAMLLWFQAVMWPYLLIVGFIASNTLGSVIFSYMNFMMFSGAVDYNNSGLFDLASLVVVWATLSITIVNACAGMIDTIPRVVFEWVGGGLNRMLNNNPELAAESAMKGMDSNFNAGVTAATGSLKTRASESKES